MEMQINASLCLARLEPALHACSAAASPFFFFFFTFGNRVGREDTGMVFISESSSTQLHEIFPPGGHANDPSPERHMSEADWDGAP